MNIAADGRQASAKVVLVTGASNGIGLATAKALDDAGWTVVGASRRPIEGSTWQHEPVDVADPDQVAALVVAVLAKRRPPLRISVGALLERAGLWAKRFLPFRVFARIAAGSLRG